MEQKTTPAQRRAVSIIEGGGKTSARRLALSMWPDSTAVRTGSAELMIYKLIAMGLVRRRAIPGSFELTEAGHALALAGDTIPTAG